MYGSTGQAPAPVRCSSSKTTKSRRELSDSESDCEAQQTALSAPAADAKPWLTEFRRYLDTFEDVLAGMSPVTWWGVHH